jgi:hypothetical protein
VRRSDDIVGLWLADAQSRPGSEPDPVAVEWAAEAWLALWPDGRFSMVLGPGSYYGRWNLSGSTLRLNVDWLVAWPPGGTGLPVAENEVYYFTWSGDMATLSAAHDGSPTELVLRRARGANADDMSRYMDKGR